VTDNPKRRWRCLQFSIATLLLVITAIGLALAPWVNRVHFQERVIADVKRLGGSVSFEHDAGKPDDPSWLQAWLGEEYFRSVSGIHLEKTTVSEDLLEQIAQLPNITELSLREDNLSDDALRPLSRLRKLKALRIGFNPITDAGLSHLANLQELLLLDLCVTKISDDGLVQLQGLPKLWRLELYGDKITNQGAATLAGIPGLGGLDLANTMITSSGLQPLAKLPDLVELRLDQMVLGEGQELRINDEALPHLLSMPKLRDLSIVSLPITPGALNALKNKRPGIIIRQ
jgi:hypothetical protein